MENLLNFKEFLNEEIGISESEFIFLNEGKQPLWPLTSNYSNVIQRKFGDISYKNALKKKGEIEKTVSNAIGYQVKLEPPHLNIKDGNPEFHMNLWSSDGNAHYQEWTAPTGKRLWSLSIDKNGYRLVRTPFEETVIAWEFDKKWEYIRKNDFTSKIKYGVQKKDQSIVNLRPADRKLNPEWAKGGAQWVYLTPGSKTYNAIKTNVFGDV